MQKRADGSVDIAGKHAFELPRRDFVTLNLDLKGMAAPSRFIAAPSGPAFSFGERLGAV